MESARSHVQGAMVLSSLVIFAFTPQQVCTSCHLASSFTRSRCQESINSQYKSSRGSCSSKIERMMYTPYLDMMDQRLGRVESLELLWRILSIAIRAFIGSTLADNDLYTLRGCAGLDRPNGLSSLIKGEKQSARGRLRPFHLLTQKSREDIVVACLPSRNSPINPPQTRPQLNLSASKVTIPPHPTSLSPSM